jgi:hypothetical protein
VVTQGRSATTRVAPSWVLGLVALGLATVATSGARAADGAVEGHVVQLDKADIVVDLARAQGAKDGAIVELWRPITLKHPITGAEITDQFLIGRLRLTQVRDTLSFARPQGTLSREPHPGDVVILRLPLTAEQAKRATPPATAASGSVALAPAPPAPSGPVTSGAARDPDADEVMALLDAVKGKGVRPRIVAYETYVRKNPNGRYAAVLWEESQKLRQLVTLEAKNAGIEPVLRTFDAPEEALAGVPITFGVELGAASGAVIHSRNPSEVSYRSVPMQAAGDGYYTAIIPAERVTTPGVEYFIEATTPSGEAVAVVGEAEAPQRLKVVDAPRPTPPPHHASIANVSTDYANWNLGHANDIVWQTEGFVGIRLEDVGIRAARTGFGVYRGRGGSLDDLDNLKLDGRTVGLTYGYLEGEYGITHFTGLIGRAVVGLQKSGVSGGMQLHLRLGNDQSTNLTLGGEVLGTIGLRGITQLELATFPKVPIVLRTEVTNQPAGSAAHGREAGEIGDSNGRGDVGARAIAQVGYRFLPQLTVSVRGSYQGRTINHAGPGVGGGITFLW